MLDLALLLQLSTVAYHQITTNFDLYPLNNVRHFTARERFKEAVSSGLIMVVPPLLLVLAIALRLPVLAYVASGASFFLFIGASLTWWPPYLFGKAFKWAAMGEDWNELHARTFAKTIVILPNFKDRPRPNLEHNVLHALILAAAIATLIYAIRASS